MFAAAVDEVVVQECQSLGWDGRNIALAAGKRGITEIEGGHHRR